MRLIDARAYRRVLDEEMDYQLKNIKNSLKYRLGIEVAIADLGDMPTVDAIPVVRCKDCKHTGTDGLGAIYCEKWDRWEMPEDFFCYYGKRKDGDG